MKIKIIFFVLMVSIQSYAEILLCSKIFFTSEFEHLSPPVSSINLENVSESYRHSQSNSETGKLLLAGLSHEKIISERADFNETYKKYPRFLERYYFANNEMRIADRYRQVANVFSIRSHGKVSGAEVLEGIVEVNSIVLKSLPQQEGLLYSSQSRIQDLPENLVGSSELRSAVFMQLKLQNKNIDAENVIPVFKQLVDLKIQTKDWKYLDQIVLNSDGRWSYSEAAYLLKGIRKTVDKSDMDYISFLSAQIVLKKYPLLRNMQTIVGDAVRIINQIMALNLSKHSQVHLMKLWSMHPQRSFDEIMKTYQRVSFNIENKKWSYHEEHSLEQAIFIYSLLFLNKPYSNTVDSKIQEEYNSYYFHTAPKDPIWILDQFLVDSFKG